MRTTLWWTLGVTTLLLAGCSAERTPANDPVATPPIHVSQDRAGTAYTPAQVRHAYGIDGLASTGTGQTIALVVAYGSPTIASDVQTFDSTFTLPAAVLSIAYPSGRPTSTDPLWALETSLDVEWAHAVAPGAKLLLVVARSSGMNDLLNAVNYAGAYAGQVSMSWGIDESYAVGVPDTYFRRSGVTYFAASGDSGAGVSWPAVSPYVVGVGGTTLTLDGSGNRLSETAWSGSGGGQSVTRSEPSYQSVWQKSGHRQVPDVSYSADPSAGFRVYDGTPLQGSSGWWRVGGTSAGSPQWAALCALANAGRSRHITTFDASLYTLGAPASLKGYYTDILSGSNGGYTAGSGFDMVTGLGVPLANTLVPKIATAQ